MFPTMVHQLIYAIGQTIIKIRRHIAANQFTVFVDGKI